MESRTLLREKYPSTDVTVHADVWPVDIRNSDYVVGRIRKRSHVDGEFREAQVWRLSPLGVEVLHPKIGTYEKGDSIDLQIVLGGRRSAFSGLVVDEVVSTEGERILGIRLSAPPLVRTGEEERRSGTRWLCSEQFYPTCVAATPARFNDFAYFRVRDVAPEGLQLECSLRNKFLIPGMRFVMTTVFPMGNVVQVPVEVKRLSVTSRSGRDRLIVGVNVVKHSKLSRRAFGQYVIQFASNVENLDQLRSAGMAPDSVAIGVDFYNLKTESDYREVLELRYRAHKYDGNVASGVSVQHMGDIHDARSRIVVGRYGDRIVATARIVFSDHDQPMEHEEHHVWPSELPRRDQIVEVSRLATDPEFRKNDLLAALIRYTGLNLFQPERPYLVISCLDSMISFYERMGFRQTGLTHHEKLWQDDKRLNVMIVNTMDMLFGRRSSPAFWNFVWRPVTETLIELGAVEPSGLDRTRYWIYRFIGPVASAFRFPRKPKSR